MGDKGGIEESGATEARQDRVRWDGRMACVGGFFGEALGPCLGGHLAGSSGGR